MQMDEMMHNEARTLNSWWALFALGALLAIILSLVALETTLSRKPARTYRTPPVASSPASSPHQPPSRQNRANVPRRPPAADLVSTGSIDPGTFPTRGFIENGYALPRGTGYRPTGRTYDTRARRERTVATDFDTPAWSPAPDNQTRFARHPHFERPLSRPPDRVQTRTTRQGCPVPQGPALSAIAGQADRLVQHGLSLARRRAYYSARAEFTNALSLIAQSLDARVGGKYHSKCLANGLRALREADDFAANASQLAADADLTGIVTGHRTPVLKYASFDNIPPLVAREYYHNYASDQLARASSSVPAASKALFGLGKVSLVTTGDATKTLLDQTPKAMAAYRAALDSDPQNYLAANELGVLLAQYGRYREANTVLQKSLTVHALPETWHNLAVVCEKLGNGDMAAFARQRGGPVVTQQPDRRERVAVTWVTPEQFAQTSPNNPHLPSPQAIPSPVQPGYKRKARTPGATWWGQTSATHLRYDAPGDVRVPDHDLSAPNAYRAVVYADCGIRSRPAAGTYLVATEGRVGRNAAIDQTDIKLCQALIPTASEPGYPTGDPGAGLQVSFDCNPFDIYGHGEYVGPARSKHIPAYRLRVADQLEFIYRLTREETATPYRLNVGDTIVVESMTDTNINRGGIPDGQGLIIQPDGTITLPLLGQVRAARLTIEELRTVLTERYMQFVRDPQITVTPLKVNTKLEDLRAAVDSRYGVGGQSRQARVTPEGTVQLPAIGSVPAQGLTLDELKREIDERYAEIVGGIEVTPILAERAPRHVFVVGEVRTPGRFALEGPTTVMQAIALGGGWNVGANLRHVVVFRRTEDWTLIATRLGIQRPLLGQTPCPADEIWLRDSDLIVVPKSSILQADNFIELIFTRGIYGVIPVGMGWDLSRASRL
jgi:polysaccharide export outer membrane protein